jgi:hypothetical protein
MTLTKALRALLAAMALAAALSGPFAAPAFADCPPGGSGGSCFDPGTGKTGNQLGPQLAFGAE